VINDQPLIERAKSGDPQAFRLLAEAWSAHLYRVVVPILRDEKEAEDAVQEALIKIHAALPTYEGMGFKTWITRIAVNQAIDMKRKLQRRPALATDTSDDFPEPVGDSPDRPILKKELRELVRSRLNELPESYRDLIIDYYLRGKSSKEIAEAKAMKPKTVEVKLHRARNWMRKHWKEDDF
jgi:RNA polymerase sigma factor (sigma-70 family)